MLTPQDLHGVLAMMPAFATNDAASVDARDTVNVPELQRSVDAIVRDGVDVLVTTGSFGEGYALLPDELRQTIGATVETVAGRIPVFAGCVGMSSRDIVDKITVAVDARVDGVMLGLPGYFPLTVQNAVQFYEDVAERFPDLAILIYHNPLLFRTFLPLDAFNQLKAIRNIVGMKDSHRDTRAFIELMEVVDHNLAVFVFAAQYLPYCDLGAAGLWSYECWMGPNPVLRLRDAVAAGDRETAIAITREITDPYEGPQPPDVRWRETMGKLSARHSGYCDPGPLRAPFVHIPEDVEARARARGEYWRGLQERYAPAAASH